MKTPLFDSHIALQAKMTSFAGWEMPVQYTGIIQEHQTVRNKVGLFDVSHMGKILVQGPDAEAFLDYLSTNKITNKHDNTATYTVWCHPNGGSVDDVMIFRQTQTQFFVIVNASNREKDLNHLLENKKNYNVHIAPQYQDGILALQGPLAESILSSFIPEIVSLKPMHFISSNELLISKTGYTGAGGYELFGSQEQIRAWWKKLIDAGVNPIGLGARDTLRLEMGYALYGHELSDTIAPSESVAAWTLKWDKNFLGKEALLTRKNRHPYGIKLLEKGVPREGYSIFKDDQQIGYVTSGSFSPTLNQGIALILVDMPLKMDETVKVKIRDNLCLGQIAKLPFIQGTV